MTGLLESAVRKLFICLGPRPRCPLIQPGYEEVPRVWPFNTVDKPGPDVRELLSMHCSWCVLDCDEAQSTSVTTTRTGLISDSGRTLPVVELQRHRLRVATRLSLCHDSVVCITATQSRPKPSTAVN